MSIKIQNRRYLGNKYKLLPFITETIKKECTNVKSIADIFAGTGSFSSAYRDKIIYTNDILYCNYICNHAWFGKEIISISKIKEIITEYNSLKVREKNYMTENFSDTFFSFSVCSKIGFVRNDIEEKYHNRKINNRERSVLLMTLLYSMDKIANTCGHYDAFRQGVDLTNEIIFDIPEVDNKNNKYNKCFNMDANELVKIIKPDLVYIDPPYNSRQYSDAYHLLENVARWEKPDVKGIARKMDRSNIKSKYCTKEATEIFKDLIDNISAKYIVLSYNNTGKKANDRSNARISDKDIINILENRGEVVKYSEDYKAFTAGKSKNLSNKERLFICKIKKKK